MADRSSCEEKLSTIASLIAQVSDSAIAAKVRAAAKANETDSVQLAAIIGRLNTIIETSTTTTTTTNTNEEAAQ